MFKFLNNNLTELTLHGNGNGTVNMGNKFANFSRFVKKIKLLKYEKFKNLKIKIFFNF